MTDEIKDIPEHAPDTGLARPQKTRKQKVSVAIASTISNSPHRSVDLVEGAEDIQEPDTSKSQFSHKRKKPQRQGDRVTRAAAPRAATKQPSKETKTKIALKTLGRKRGASIAELQEITGWQPHSVRGFLSGAVKKKLGLHVASEVGKDGVRRYRIDDGTQAGSAGQAG